MRSRQNRNRSNRPALAATAFAFAAAVALGACSSPDVEKARALDIRGEDVGAEAAREYRRLAIYEDGQMWDRASARTFSRKALAAMDGRIEPDRPDARPIDGYTRDELTAAYRYMYALMEAGAPTVAPKQAGQAIARLDCWTEQAAEGYQARHIAFCRDGFREYAEETARALKAAGRYLPEAQPAIKTFTVRFPDGGRQPGPGADRALDEAAQYAKSNGFMRVVLGGHTDRAGSAGRNQRISEARAEAVARLLRSRGVPSERISVIGFGETYPLVATPDGQKSLENRRVEIVIGPGSSL